MTAEGIFDKVKETVAEQFELDLDDQEITMETSFEKDLGADSLDLVDIALALEDYFGVNDEDMDEGELSKIKTVGDIVNFLVRLGV